jgi:hypothetical protein
VVGVLVVGLVLGRGLVVLVAVVELLLVKLAQPESALLVLLLVLLPGSWFQY